MNKKPNIDKLFHNDSPTPYSPPNQKGIVEKSEEQIIKICTTLSHSPNYKPEYSLSAIRKYYNSNDYLDRMLYSQISAYIFNLSDERCDNFSSNISIFLHYAIDTEKDENVRKLVIRLYDHAELAIRQKTMLSNDLLIQQQKSLESDFSRLKEDMNKAQTEYTETIKSTQRDYITIFGIFSAIIISFVGGISFSSSVLENMTDVSVFRLILVICLLALVLFNVIYYLISVILKVSKIEISKCFHFIKWNISIPLFFNLTIITIMLFDIVMYFLHMEQLRTFFDLPWLKS